MSKPEWNEDTPKWANWLAQDSDGEWWWYSHKPFEKPTSTGWNMVWADDSSDFEFSGMTDECAPIKGWRKTLEPRP